MQPTPPGAGESSPQGPPVAAGPVTPGNAQVAAVESARRAFDQAISDPGSPLASVADAFDQLHSTLSNALSTLEG